jgi:regulator of sigma E protease
MSIILFIIVLAVLILSHEFGHFIVAKKSGMRVDEFGFGFPPRLFKFKKGDTTYSFNLIPIGGFVKIYGEDGEDGCGASEGRATSEDPRSFSSKSHGIRAAVIGAGVFFNLLLAWFLLSLGFLTGLPTSIASAPANTEIKDIKIIIVAISPNSPAAQAGLKPGDEIIGFAKIEDAQKFINENKGKEIELKYKRGGEISSAKLIPRINPPEGQGAIGIAMDEAGIVKLPFYKAIWQGLKMTYHLTIAIAVAIFSFIVAAVKGLAGFESVMGPVGIVAATGVVAKLGFAYFLSFIALLSINLAVINIIPFPALDGGRLFFLLIEKIKGSAINPRFSSIVHTVGLAILLILMIAITYKDILKLI